MTAQDTLSAPATKTGEPIVPALSDAEWENVIEAAEATAAVGDESFTPSDEEIALAIEAFDYAHDPMLVA